LKQKYFCKYSPSAPQERKFRVVFVNQPKFKKGTYVAILAKIAFCRPFLWHLGYFGQEQHYPAYL